MDAELGLAEVQEPDAIALQHVKDRIEKEKGKGVATRNQQAIWDKILEMRILLQKSLTMSRQLPLLQDLTAVKMFSPSISSAMAQINQVRTAI